jgi:hypothetical protein
MNSKKYLSITLSIVFIIASGFSLSNMVPAVLAQEANDVKYDLIAKVNVNSLDTTREIQFIESLDTQAFGYPVDLDLVETLRESEHYNGSRVLVQGYGYYRGVKVAPPPSFIEVLKRTDTVAVGGMFYSDMNYLVLVTVFSDKEWDRFMKQAEETGDPISDSGGNSLSEDSERVRALKERISLRNQITNGEISEEEYREKMDRLDEYLRQPEVIINL